MMGYPLPEVCGATDPPHTDDAGPKILHTNYHGHLKAKTLAYLHMAKDDAVHLFST